MTTWVKQQFRDPKHAMTAISVTSLTIAVVGAGIIFLSALLNY